MAILITGVAGFVGVNLAAKFICKGYRVFGIDNFSRGTRSNMSHLFKSDLFEFMELDLTDPDSLLSSCLILAKKEPVDEVWHLAANSDIPAGVADAAIDLKDTFMTTYHILNMMNKIGIYKLAFASSSAIYGDHGSNVLYENMGSLMPISNYGAMKLGSEAMISAAAESFLQKAWIFRFPNVVGVPATHGVILDFIRKLMDNPDKLTVLGDGTQLKTYLHISELLEAMFWIREHAQEKITTFNIGADDAGMTVKFIAQEVVRKMGDIARIDYGQGNKGWVGDVPKFSLSIDRLKKLGWTPKMNSKESILQAIKEIVSQECSSEDNKF